MYSTHRQAESIQLDSRLNEVDHESETECTFFFNRPISKSLDEDFLICLNQFQCPNTMYTITSSNNLLVLDFDGIGLIEVELEPGNYTSINFSEEVTNQLASFVETIETVICVFNTRNNKFTITSTTYNFSISSDSTVLTIMGMKNDSDSSYSSSITGTDICDFSGVYDIYFKVLNLNILNTTTNNGLNNSIAQIHCNALQGDIIFYKPSEPIYYRISDDTLNNIHMQLVDINNNPIDLNGGHFTFEMIIHYQHKTETIPKGPINLKTLYKVEKDPKKNKNS